MTRLVLLMLLLLPAACAAPGSTSGPTSGPNDPTSAEPLSAKTEQPAQPQPAAKPEHPDLGLLPPNHTHGSALPGDDAVNPEDLIGLHDTDLQRLLGTPDFLRMDPPAQLWQYRNSLCRFDVFLYQDKNHANAYSVTHVEARGLDVNRVSGKDCFFSVLRTRDQG